MFGENNKNVEGKYCILMSSGACSIVENTGKLFKQ